MPNCRKAIDDFYKTAILGKCPKPTTLGREGSPKILNMCLEGEKRLAWKQSGVDCGFIFYIMRAIAKFLNYF